MKAYIRTNNAVTKTELVIAAETDAEAVFMAEIKTGQRILEFQEVALIHNENERESCSVVLDASLRESGEKLGNLLETDS